MATVYLRTQDKNKKRPAYFIGYTDERGRRRTQRGFTDKRETERLAAKIEHDVMLKKRGLVDVEKEQAAEARALPLSTHLDAFKESLNSKSNTEKHVKLTMSRVLRVVDIAGFEMLEDVDSERAVAALRKLKLGARTWNHYVQGLEQFGAWLVPKRAQRNPLQGLPKKNAETDVRKKRRALTPEEFAALVRSARESGVTIQGFDGETRARIYLMSYFTGLRRSELGSLTPRSFDLTANPPTVTIEAIASKHRRKDVLPIHPELLNLLPNWLHDFETCDLLFPRIGNRKTHLMVKKDLERAGIPYETADGQADFHAAGRHTYITELLRNGASVVEAKELARHADVQMTMKYTHIGLEDQARAIGNLPAPPSNDDILRRQDTPKSLPATNAAPDSEEKSMPTTSTPAGSIPAASTLLASTGLQEHLNQRAERHSC